MAIETVTSPLLTGPPADPKPQAQSVSEDFAKTVKAGYLERDPDVWFASLGGPR
ncbi:hypothetical protein ACLF6K_37170 [Streptomyces xanthophaeus]|uniref:hypothetical protein n=1 Tax=Streptomyces xanthophaeus TaxID=67385 RepID=UPI00398FA03A